MMFEKTPEKFAIKIYNPSGSLVYESNSYDNKWNGEGVSGTYFYYLKNLYSNKEYNGRILVVE